jgi:hypothetical protein
MDNDIVSTKRTAGAKADETELKEMKKQIDEVAFKHDLKKLELNVVPRV